MLFISFNLKLLLTSTMYSVFFVGQYDLGYTARQTKGEIPITNTCLAVNYDTNF